MPEAVPHAAPAPPPAPPPPPKKRRWGWVLLVLLLLLAVGVWLAPGILAKTAYKDKIVADLTGDVNGSVRVGEVSLNWLHPVDAADVSVSDAAGNPVLSAKRITTSKTLLSLLLNRTDLGTLTVHQPRAEVRFENGTTNVQQVFAKYIEAKGEGKPTRPAVSVELVDGTVKLHHVGKNESGELTGVSGTASVPANTAEPIRFSVKATGGGPISADGEVGSGGRVNLDASDFDLATVGPAVRHFAPTVTVGGRLKSKLALTWTPRESGPPAFTASGDVHVQNLSLAAPALGPDPVRLASADMPVSASFDGKAVKVSKLRLTCDVGTVGFAGTLDPSATPEDLLAQSGLTFDADVDLARLGRVAPGLLRLKPGTELTSGRITADVSSGASDKGVTWNGAVVASRIEGKRDGKTLTWEQPLTVRFAGRLRPDGLPAFDSLVVQSDFIGGQARGEPESFDAVADIDLSKLGGHLDDLLDLNGLKLQGRTRDLLVQVRPKDGGGVTLTASGTVQNLAVSDNSGVLASDPNLTLSAKAEGKIGGGKVRVDSGSLTVTAGSDTLAVSLLEPVADVKAIVRDPANATGRASVAVTGDLAKWRGRVGRLVGWPKDWDIGGTATEATAMVQFGKLITAERVRLAVTNARFHGLGMAIDEPTLRLDAADAPDPGTVTFDPITATTVFTRMTVQSETVSGAVARFEIKPDAKGEWGGRGKANVVARLARVQRTLQFQKAADLSDQFRGVATGLVELDAPTFDRLNFTVDTAVKDFSFGPPKSPVWMEPNMTVRGGVGYQLSADTLTLSNATVERDGLSVSGSGTIAKMTTDMTLNVSGTLGYDLARLEPLLKQYLGKTASASGKGSKPFRANGTLFGKNGADVSRMSGQAGLGWDTLRAYGFDVGKGELTATAERGIVTATPITATFGGGTVVVEPTVRLLPNTFDLSFKPGRVVDKAKLTPAVCADALGYALPAIANSAQAEGSVSFDLGDNRFPLSDPMGGSFKGNLTIHEASVAPTGAIAELLTLLDIKQPTVQLAKGSVVPVELKDGWVSHSDLVLLVGTTTVRSSGRVRTDGAMDLTLSVPVGVTLAEKLLPDRPKLQAAVAKQSISVKVTGTLTKPTLDADGVRGQLAAVVKGAAKEAVQEKGQDVLDDVLKKGLDKLLKPKR